MALNLVSLDLVTHLQGLSHKSKPKDPQYVSLSDLKINQKQLETWLAKYNCKFKKSAIFNFYKQYKNNFAFGADSILRILLQDNQLSDISEFKSRSQMIQILPEGLTDLKTANLNKNILKGLALLVKQEISLSGWLNEQYISKLFEVNSGEINALFNFGETSRSKISYFLNIRHKTDTSQKEIQNLVSRIERYSDGLVLVSNIFCSVRKKKFTFSQLPDANLLLSNILPLNKKRRASLSKGGLVKAEFKKGSQVSNIWL